MNTVTKLSRKEIRTAYKNLELDKIKITEWWAIIENQDQDVVKSVIQEVGKIANRLYSIKTAILRRPEVGKGCTYGAGSDSYPATIVEVSKNGKTIWVTSDSHTPTEDCEYYGNQSYTYKSNIDGERTCYTLRKNGSWIRKGSPINAYWCGIGIGSRRYYQDPSF
tara:strand:- start:8898 stop:9392 length:495 start_codon:yes stop_codon:yes gene_type:complete